MNNKYEFTGETKEFYGRTFDDNKYAQEYRTIA